ncbi:MAG: hypothetical protein GY948_11930 [Alphaproteobacteria bacterium]|nr:hypothetical protein [Alphaproteobacteria bacterium]
MSMVDDQREDFGLLYAQLRNTQRVSLKQRSIWVIMSIMLIGFIASAGTIMAYYFLPNQDLLFGERKSAGSMDKLIHVEYGGDEYVIPEPFVRQVHRTVIGGVKRIEVRVPWPYWSGDRKPIFADALNRLTGSLFISFEPRPDKLEPEERITRVYYRYFAGPPVATREGTQRYTFRSDSPYPFAELFKGALQGRQVIIRCEPGAERSGPSLCESEIPLNETTVARYRFHRSHLPEWRALDKTARELIATFRQPAAPG